MLLRLGHVRTGSEMKERNWTKYEMALSIIELFPDLVLTCTNAKEVFLFLHRDNYYFVQVDTILYRIIVTSRYFITVGVFIYSNV